MSMAKKRHHYVPKAYLKSFCDDEGKTLVYRKDDPVKPLHTSPDNTAFHKYFYSQPKPGGEKDHNALEDCFSTIEAKWPMIVDRLHRRENVNDLLMDIIMFISLQRVRVPASRDLTEKIYAEYVMLAARQLDKAGKLPPKPEGFEDLLDHVQVSINPHQSIHAMVPVLQATGQVFDQIGFCAMHNKTDMPFLTSDNPVIWFDPSVQDSDLRPYVLRPGGPIVFIFPVSPSLIIYGDSSMRDQFVSEGLGIADQPNTKVVEAVNRQVCRFGYQAVFAQKPGQERLIQRHAALSPTISFDRAAGKSGPVSFQMIFGKREPKTKWVD
jgi:hypothetical protein